MAIGVKESLFFSPARAPFFASVAPDFASVAPPSRPDQTGTVHTAALPAQIPRQECKIPRETFFFFSNFPHPWHRI